MKRKELIKVKKRRSDRRKGTKEADGAKGVKGVEGAEEG